MSALTAETNATNGIRSSPVSRLTAWAKEWNQVPYFAQTRTHFRVCPSLMGIVSATSQEELKTASDKVLTTIEGWETLNRESRSYVRPSSSEVGASAASDLHSQDDKQPTRRARDKAYKVLGVSSEEREWVPLADLAPHVRMFVEAKTREMERFLAEQPSEASAR